MKNYDYKIYLHSCDYVSIPKGIEFAASVV